MRVFLFIFVSLFSTSSLSQDYSTAVDDASKNYYLAKTLEKETDPAVEALRVYVVFQLVTGLCLEVTLDDRVMLDMFGSIVEQLKPRADDMNDIRFQVRHRMRQFDVHDAIHLCAGAMSLFGPRGELWKGVLLHTNGKTRFPPGASGYLRVPLP